LRIVAKRLRKCVRDSDTVARLGGDEFTVLLEDISRDYVPAVIAEKILKALAKPYLINGRELNITASIGIGIYPANGDSVVEIFKNADTAMYCVKENGRNNFMAYDHSMNDKAIEMMDMENCLRKALEAGELSLLYQPKLNVATGKIVALEALLRWENPVLGFVPPDRFIPLAESTGLIHPIGAWVIHEVCRQNREWQRKGLKPVEMAVNISSLQFSDARFIDSIDQALIDSGMDSSYLELEITESTIMRTDKVVMNNIARLKERGLMLSIDDFGTGYSSLSVIKQFPIDSLKIDQSFVRDIDSDPDDEAIVTTIIAMARSLKLNVIAEGVETAEQMQCLVNKGCDLIQGYWVSRPLDPQAVEELLSQDPDFFSDNYDQRSQFRR
jgi:predicted signal transduction protein with EAL and GGDEF domain